MITAALAVVGRFGVNIAYSSGAQYAAELIPTEVRGQGVSAIHMVGYAATFFSSHILYLVSIEFKSNSGCRLPFNFLPPKLLLYNSSPGLLWLTLNLALISQCSSRFFFLSIFTYSGGYAYPRSKTTVPRYQSERRPDEL
jgi:hypothetical protein